MILNTEFQFLSWNYDNANNSFRVTILDADLVGLYHQNSR